MELLNVGLLREENLELDSRASRKIKRKNQILFSKDSAFLQDLALLIQGQSHKTLALWAFDLAGESVAVLKEKYPQETRPEEALLAAKDWAAGNVKMRFAQRKILDCHAVAKELTDKSDIAACHAVGQACAVVHTAGHALGYPMYDLSAIVYRLGIENCQEEVEKRKQTYIAKLFYWQSQDQPGPWADFMLR